MFAENYLTDHLGNVRVAYTVNTAGTGLITRQVDSYYPSRMNIRELTASLSGSDRQNEYLYNGKMFQDEGGLNWLDYGARMYDVVICRFTSGDPVAEFFPWMTNYQYASNNPVKNIDLDGLEGIFFTVGSPLLGSSNPLLMEAAKPTLVEGLTEAGGQVAGKVVETSGEVSKPMPVEQIAKGVKTEAEQLAKNGYEKNTKPITKVDPKTGKEGTTIPDALKNGGKSSSEVKNLKQQSLTEQLRLQEKFSNDNGFKPELIINEGAKLSKPLQKSSFNIIKFNIIPPAVQDNTRIALPIPLQIIKIQTGQQGSTR